MTALEWHQRLRLMSRCTIVELKPSEAGELADLICELEVKARVCDLHFVATNKPKRTKR